MFTAVNQWESAEVIQASDWMPQGRPLLDMLEGLYIPSGLGTPDDPIGGGRQRQEKGRLENVLMLL